LAAKPEKVTWVSWGVFLAQDLLHALYVHDRTEFNRRFLGGDRSNIARFWQQAREDDPRFQNHPMKTKPSWRESAIPGRVHGDGVPYGKGRLASANVTSWSSKLSGGHVLDWLNLWSAVPKSILCKKEQHGYNTEEYLFRAFIYDAHCCVQGEFCEYDWTGSAWPHELQDRPKSGHIMGGMTLALIQLGADNEYLANTLRLPHWQSLDPCAWCPADQRRLSTRLWADFRDSAEWKLLLVTLAMWEANPCDHVLWRAFVLIGLTMFSVCLDILHCVDKGVLAYFGGSAVWTLVHESGLPGSFYDKAALVWGMIRQAYDDAGLPAAQRLPREEFYAVFGGQTGSRPGSFPELSGKAAHLRHFLPVLTTVCEQIHARQGISAPQHEDRLRCLHLLRTFYETCARNGEFMPADDAQLVMQTVEEFLLRQNTLAMHYFEKDVQLYNVTFKSHHFWHLAHQCQYFNPQAGWCYGDERFVGHVARLTKSIVMGGGAIALQKTLPEKWRWAQWFRYRRRMRGAFDDGEAMRIYKYTC